MDLDHGLDDDGGVTDLDRSDLARAIGPVLKRLYPQNPDVVLGREARAIAEAIAPVVMGIVDRGSR